MTLLNHTIANQQIQQQAQQQSQDTYFLYIVVSLALSSLVYVFLFGKPLIVAATWYGSGRRLLARYVGNSGKGVILMNHVQSGIFGSMITMEDAMKIEHFVRKLRAHGVHDIDLIVNTFGGDLLASIRIARLLKEDKRIKVIVPKYAWSGGSLISISASRLAANNSSIFGAVDPQIGSLFTAFSAKDWQDIMHRKGKEVKDETIGMSLISERLMKEMRGYLDHLTEDKGLDKQRFYDLFLDGDYTHAHMLSPKDLRSCGLEVETLDTELPDLIVEKMRKSSGVFAYAKQAPFVMMGT